MTTITAVTTPAGRADRLTDADYRDIYDELRGYLSLADFILRSGSTVSRSWWSQYEAGVKHLSTARRNELRTAVGHPEIAPDVLTAVSEVTSNASVWRVGTGAADRVIMVATGAPETLNLRVNGGVHIADLAQQQNPADAEVTPVTAYRSAPRPTCYRPRLALDLATRITQLEALLQAARAQLEDPR